MKSCRTVTDDRRLFHALVSIMFANLKFEYAEVFYKVSLKICSTYAYLRTCLCKFDHLYREF